jgi:hypothetical protein
VTTETSYEGAKDVKNSATSQADIYRDITAIESGTFYVSMKASSISTNDYLLFCPNSGGTAFCVELNTNGGYLVAYRSGGRTNIQAISANTYYRVGVQFECGAGGYEGLSADTFKVNVDGGDWSDAFGFVNAKASISRLAVQTYYVATAGRYIDYISPNYEPIVASAFIKIPDILWFE